MKSISERMRELPEPKDGPWPDWDHWRLDLWRHGIQDDPETFTDWDCIKHTMLVGWRDMSQRYQALPTRHKRICDSLPSPLRESAIEQASHLYHWQEEVGTPIQWLDSIYEFGAGYGQMAWLCHKLGFGGRYTIRDLPEFQILQEWWLDKEGIGARWTDKPEASELFIAIYSIAELPADERQAMIPKSAYHLYTYSQTRTTWDQLEWFTQNIAGKHIKMHDRDDWYCFK